MNIIDRYKKPTPKFFRIIRNIGIAMATAGSAVLATPMQLPEYLIMLCGFIIIAGTIATAISQAAVEEKNGHTPTKECNDGQ